jgi:hypothetical protein
LHSGFTEFYESFRYQRFYLARCDHLADFWEVNNQLQAKAQAASMQMRDPERAQVISPNDPDLIMASTFDGEGKNTGSWQKMPSSTWTLTTSNRSSLAHCLADSHNLGLSVQCVHLTEADQFGWEELTRTVHTLMLDLIRIQSKISARL